NEIHRVAVQRSRLRAPRGVVDAHLAHALETFELRGEHAHGLHEGPGREGQRKCDHRYRLLPHQRTSPCFASQSWISAATCRLFLSIISMGELPFSPALGRSSTSTLPPAFVISPKKSSSFLRICGQRESSAMLSPNTASVGMPFSTAACFGSPIPAG